MEKAAKKYNSSSEDGESEVDEEEEAESEESGGESEEDEEEVEESEESIATPHPPKYPEGRTAFVSSLSFDSTEEGIRKHFGEANDVIEKVLVEYNNSGRSAGFAYVIVSDESDLGKILAFNSSELDARNILVRPYDDSLVYRRDGKRKKKKKAAPPPAKRKRGGNKLRAKREASKAKRERKEPRRGGPGGGRGRGRGRGRGSAVSAPAPPPAPPAVSNVAPVGNTLKSKTINSAVLVGCKNIAPTN